MKDFSAVIIYLVFYPLKGGGTFTACVSAYSYFYPYFVLGKDIEIKIILEKISIFG